MDPFKIGDVIADKYKIERVLGQGGMGVVVAARRLALGDLVAIKFLRSSLNDKPESDARFAREARVATRIKNVHVAHVYDVGRTDDGAPFIVMEYLEGEDLARVLKRRGPLPAAEAVDLLLQACEAIADAHNLGIVHRDLKPANLFVTTRSDGTPLVKVLDFGISKSTSFGDLSVTESAAVVGSPLYMSPEQLRSSRTVDARADLWSLGVILYEMLTGRTPFAGESFATLSAAILRGTFTPVSEVRPDVPAPLEQAIAEALAPEPGDRLPTVAAFAARLAPCGSDAARASCERIEGIAARVPPLPEPAEGDVGGAGEAGGITVPQAPPESVARVMEAPAEITQPPALGRSVAAPARRPLPRLAMLALAAGGAGLIVAAGVLVVQRGSPSPAATTAQGAGGEIDAMPATGASPVAPDSFDDPASTAPADDREPRWPATPIAVKDFALTDFAVAAPPSQAHPRGVIGALAVPRLDGAQTAIALIAIDLESGRDIARNPVGSSAEGSVVRIARARRGVLLAHQQRMALELHWFTDGTVEEETRMLPRFAAKTKNDELRGFATFDDRIVLATGGSETTTVWILDEKGNLLTSHPCHGGLFRPGDAQLVPMGDDVIVANFTMKSPDIVPVCAGRLHGPPRWREVSLHGGELQVGVGGVYFSRSGGAGKATIHALDEDLQPTGPAPPKTDPIDAVPCSGLTGTIRRRTEEVGGQLIISMTACCGDEGGGLFVCRPPGHGP